MDFEVICPYCNKSFEDYGDVIYQFADEFTQIQCNHCEEEFEFKWNAYFTSKKVEK